MKHAICGVDGGGSRTRALVTDAEGRELGSGRGPAGIVVPGREDAAVDAVEQAVRAAAEDAGVALPVDALHCGLAGSESSAGASERIAGELRERGLAGAVSVGTDVDAAFRDVFGREGSGILVVSGTGSVVVGRSESGERYRAGGWGAGLGDEGSAYGLGMAALRAVLRAHDGRGRRTVLTKAMLHACEVDRPEELVGYAAESSKARIASHAPEIVHRAEVGDLVARTLVDEALSDLVEQVEAVAARMDEPDSSTASLPVALAGGMVEAGKPFRDRLVAALAEGGFSVVQKEVRGDRGAAALAGDLLE